jgi:hypothetical protein
MRDGIISIMNKGPVLKEPFFTAELITSKIVSFLETFICEIALKFKNLLWLNDCKNGIEAIRTTRKDKKNVKKAPVFKSNKEPIEINFTLS